MKKLLLVLSLMLCTIGLTGCGGSKISEEKAQEIALRDAGVDPADTTSMHVGYEDMGELDAHYEVVFQTQDTKYDYDINAKTGAIMSKEKESIYGADNSTPSTNDNQSTPNQGGNGQAKLSAQEAKDIALKDAGVQASDAFFDRVELDTENGRMVYEIEFTCGTTEYDYDIDANTGVIVSKSYESSLD